MTAKNARCCGNCRSAIFHEMPNGKRDKKQCGKCLFEVKWPPIPYFLRDRLPRKTSVLGITWDEGIWPRSGEDCQCWESKA